MVTKETYLKLKKMQTQTSFRSTCWRCFRALEACPCHLIKPFKTNLELCLLMHPREARKERVGTGRLTALALERSRLIIDENFVGNELVEQLISDPTHYSMVLYPGADSHNITTHSLQETLQARKLRLFVIDGTWSCAKSMMRDSSNLHKLPRLSFSMPGPSRFAIKQQPAEYCLSTIESVFHVLDALQSRGEEDIGREHQQLLGLLDFIVNYQLTCTQDPQRVSYRRGNFRAPEVRRPAKKWSSREICFYPHNYINQR